MSSGSEKRWIMSDSDRMPKIDINKLRHSDVEFIKEIEKKNFERVQKLKLVRRNNLITAALLGVGVLGTMAVSQKTIVVEKDPRFLPTLELLQEASKQQTEMQIEIGDICNYQLQLGLQGAPKHDWYDASPPIHLIGMFKISLPQGFPNLFSL
nr:unnamed protein product [Callosobruchus analis]